MNTNVVSDAELMARVAKQDKRALEELYDRHAAAALGMALKIMGERSAAEEIVQEAFWRVWKRAPTFELGRGQFRPWLFGIVHNLAIDELRRRRVRPNTISTDAADDARLELPDSEMDVAATAFANVTREQVRRALAGLPAAQRSVIELAFFEGLTHQEIAAHLNEPVGTVHTRARLALQKLRQVLLPLEQDQV
ncbi:MAG: sigma-70 family RNA polymerase sigma factor [Chloroflexi bacterium]|nr:sigma-70 family RNA polymerase sigma factor [Chloroflexota bacterium]